MTTFDQFQTIAEARAIAGGRIFAAGYRALLRIGRAWANRRRVAELLEWDERMLRDIGLTPGDVRSALSGSTGDDPATRLHVLALERRATAQALARGHVARRGRGEHRAAPRSA